MARLRFVISAIDRLSNRIHGSRGLLSAVFGLGYFLLAHLIASNKPLWYDEIVTLYVCRLPEMRDVWAALLDGADANPPLFHLLTRASLGLLGDSSFALRLPSILGFAALCWSAFRFASKRVSDAAAWSGVGFLFLTGAYYYMSEARPYSLVLGWSGLALVCWQSATEGSKRLASIFGMTVCCGAALSSHYIGVLILAPLFVGELVRWRNRGRIDRPIVAGLVAALLPLVLYTPLITAAGTYGQNAGASPSIGSILFVYDALVKQGSFVFVALAVLSLWRLVSPSPPASKLNAAAPNAAPRPQVPGHELAAVMTLCLAPLIAIVGGYVMGGFIYRYAIITVAGFALLFSYAVALSSRRYSFIGGLAVVVVVATFLSREHFAIIRSLRGTESFQMPSIVTRAVKEQVVVIESPVAYLQYQHYASREVAERLYSVVDVEQSRRITGNPSPDIGLIALRKWAPIQAEEYDVFLGARSEFLVYQTTHAREFSWLLVRLSREASREVRLIAGTPAETLYHVQQK